jgi:hypothetical protein
MNRLFLSACLLATSAIAGPYDQVYRIITVDRSPSSDPNLRTVTVNRVDDETVMTGNKAVVAPGMRKLTVDLHPRKGFPATQVTFDLDVKPCTRYNVAAKLDSPTLQTWKPIVRSTEPIGECAAKYLVAGAK